MSPSGDRPHLPGVPTGPVRHALRVGVPYLGLDGWTASIISGALSKITYRITPTGGDLLPAPPTHGPRVTGGSRVIGLGIAEMLVDCGSAVTLSARNSDRLHRAAPALSARGGEVRIAAVDLESRTIEEASEGHEKAFDGMSGLVLAARVGSAGDFTGDPISRCDTQIVVNVRAPYMLVSQAPSPLRRTAPTHPDGC